MSDVRDLIRPKKSQDLSLAKAISLIKDRKLTSKDKKAPILARKKISKTLTVAASKTKVSKKDIFARLKFESKKEDDFERSLRKLATKGAVKLFNTINKTKQSL